MRNYKHGVRANADDIAEYDVVPDTWNNTLEVTYGEDVFGLSMSLVLKIEPLGMESL